MKILVCDPISDDAVKLLRQSMDVVFDYRPDITAAQLLEVVKDYDALIVRSRTKVTRDVMLRASRLKVIGRAGVGVDNIDANAASERKAEDSQYSGCTNKRRRRVHHRPDAGSRETDPKSRCFDAEG